MPPGVYFGAVSRQADVRLDRGAISRDRQLMPEQLDRQRRIVHAVYRPRNSAPGPLRLVETALAGDALERAAIGRRCVGSALYRGGITSVLLPKADVELWNLVQQLARVSLGHLDPCQSTVTFLPQPQVAPAELQSKDRPAALFKVDSGLLRIISPNVT